MTTLFISHSSKDKAWANEIHAWLRDQHYEALFLDTHPDDGIKVGEKWEKTLYQRLRQSRGLVVLCTNNWLASPWCVAEAMMARERGKPVFLLAANDISNDDGVSEPPFHAGKEERQRRATVGMTSRETMPQQPLEMPQASSKAQDQPAATIPDFFKDTQFIPLVGLSKEKAYELLRQGLKAALRPQDSFLLPQRPYPGLEPFQEEDAAVFFGRDPDIQRVEAVLTQRRRNNAEAFILILGASGCGKSSLIRAGVVPRLKRSTAENSSGGRWVILPPFSAGRGLEGLARSLSQAFKSAGRPRELSALRTLLNSSERNQDGMNKAKQALRELISELLDANSLSDGHVLLVLDQLEEVFDSNAGFGTRSLLTLLLEASIDREDPLTTLATMRSDFLNAFQLFPGSTDCFKGIPLNPMQKSCFSEVIEGPADCFGLSIEPGLSECLVEDTGHNDALPLLAFTLERLYEKCRTQDRLTFQAYFEIGGVSATIKREADLILEDTGYTGLATDNPRMRDLRRAFNSLALVGEAGQFTRRTARWASMPPSCKEILSRFLDKRLLVSGAENSEPALSVSHEALFRVWDTLHDWLQEDRKALALRAGIEGAAAEWDAEGREASRAWPEERILYAVGEIERCGVSLDDATNIEVVRAFLGPTDPSVLSKLPALGIADNIRSGSGRYGAHWRLPLVHEARMGLGVRLAVLGDRRKGVGLQSDGLPDIDWCWIEGGEVTIAIHSKPEDPNSEVIDNLTRTVDSFSISRYPVTIAQFRAYLARCFQDGRWLSPPGLNLPPDWPMPRHRTHFGNHPADSVSWYNATAFCHWLSSEIGCGIRLPTEFEWQLAATGGDPENVYPWGSEWDLDEETWRANTFESGLNCTTAVGMYPHGASQSGVEDMAGNLWEWCSNAFNEPDEIRSFESAADSRVLRGASWFEFEGFARCAARYSSDPYNRLSNVGFRIACSSRIKNAQARA